MRPSPRRIVVLDGGADVDLRSATRYLRGSGRVVRCDPWPAEQAPRLYVEALLPALLGYEDVLLVRSWVGRDDLPPARRRMLDRVAARCATAVTWVLDGDDDRRWPTTALPVTVIGGRDDRALPRTAATLPHPLACATGGWLDAPVVLVGEALAEPKRDDPLFRVPFVSFGDEGCSAWLTGQLADIVDEDELLWANADDRYLGEALATDHRCLVVALGREAAQRLTGLGVAHEEVNHPQHAKRFHHREPYALVGLIQQALAKE